MLSVAGSLALDALPLLQLQMLGLPYTFVHTHQPITPTTKKLLKECTYMVILLEVKLLKECTYMVILLEVKKTYENT